MVQAFNQGNKKSKDITLGNQKGKCNNQKHRIKHDKTKPLKNSITYQNLSDSDYVAMTANRTLQEI